ncbi:hypothetical protein [Verrucomicrobium sp. GAS474]|uniref:hypothetical protein n=1 Tax=Verrucomicrobium sp. GAS474 TaxID=1882831 RepID=UPI0012FFCECE|nr:hypothetical protein [Verrucomicrobium sp. GAS474]
MQTDGELRPSVFVELEPQEISPSAVFPDEVIKQRVPVGPLFPGEPVESPGGQERIETELDFLQKFLFRRRLLARPIIHPGVDDNREEQEAERGLDMRDLQQEIA